MNDGKTGGRKLGRGLSALLGSAGEQTAAAPPAKAPKPPPD